jgi:hypothetical protein
MDGLYLRQDMMRLTNWLGMKSGIWQLLLMSSAFDAGKRLILCVYLDTSSIAVRHCRHLFSSVNQICSSIAFATIPVIFPLHSYPTLCHAIDRTRQVVVNVLQMPWIYVA